MISIIVWIILIRVRTASSSSKCEVIHSLSSSTYEPNILPHIYDCVEETFYPIELKKDEALLYVPVLKFTKTRRSFSESPINCNNKYHKKVSLGLMVNANNGTGTLLHYKSSQAQVNVIDEFRVDMVNWGLTARFCYNGNCSFEIIQMIGNVLAPDQWTFFGIERKNDASLSYYTISSDPEKPHKNVNSTYKNEPYKHDHKDLVIDLNGKLRLGASFDNDIGTFQGSFACLMLSEKVEKERKKLNQKCLEKLPRTISRSCTNTTPDVKYLWPLNDKTYGYECKTGSPPIKPLARSDWSFDTSVTGLQKIKATVLNEAMELKLKFYMVANTFSVVMFVYLSSGSTTDQTLLTLTYNTWTDCYTSIDIIITNKQSIKAVMKDYSNNILAEVEVILVSTGADKWILIGVQINRYWEELSIIVDNQYKKTQISSFRSCTTTSSSLFWLKTGSPTGAPNKLVCLTVFSNLIDENTAWNRLTTECNNCSNLSIPAADAPKPIAVWPLNQASRGYEVLSNKTTNNISDVCWRFNPVDFKTLLFYGSDRFSLNLNQISITDTLLSVGIFINPEPNVTGTILEIPLTTSASSNTLTLTLRFITNSLELIVHQGGPVKCTSSKVPFPSEKWSSVLIQTTSSGELYMIIDGTEQQPTTSCPDVSKVTFHEIILGKSTVYTVDDDFRGRLRCLSVFNVTVPATDAQVIMKTECAANNNFVIQGNPTFPATNNIWYVDNTSLVGGKKISTMELLTRNKSLAFDGSSLKHVLLDLTIGYSSELALGIFIRPKAFTSGPVLISGGGELEIVISDNTLKVLFKTDGASGASCGPAEFQNIHPDEWHLLMIQRTTFCKTIMVILGQQTRYIHSNCFKTEALNQLKIRLGGEKEPSLSNFRGEIGCVALFNYTIASTTVDFKQTVIKSCNQPNTLNDFVVENAKYLSVKESVSVMKHQLILRDSKPRDTSILSSVKVKSLTHCSRVCSMTDNCRSFVFAVEGSKICSMFDFVSVGGGLRSVDNHNYYALVSYQYVPIQ